MLTIRREQRLVCGLCFTWVDEGSRQRRFPVSARAGPGGCSPVKVYKVTFVWPCFCPWAERVMVLGGSVFWSERSVSIDTKLWVENFLWILCFFPRCLPPPFRKRRTADPFIYCSNCHYVSCHILILLAWTIFKAQFLPYLNVFLNSNLNRSNFLQIKNVEVLSFCLQSHFL